MKATELRIGNYFVAAHESNMPIFQIKSFYENGVHAGYGKIYSFRLVLPIKLTEDWLLKCNVQKRTTMGETWQRRFVYKPGSEMVLNEIPEWINYVHELQNWYYWKFNKTELKIIE